MSKHGRIATEIKQHKGFASLSEEAMLTLMRTADVIRHQSAKAMTEHTDITHQQYNVLRILRGAGNEGMPTLQIAERMVEVTPGITRLIDRLIKKELVSRHPCANDRRQVFCRITERGLSLLKELDPILDAYNQAWEYKLNNEELKTLITLLDRLRS